MLTLSIYNHCVLSRSLDVLKDTFLIFKGFDVKGFDVKEFDVKEFDEFNV